MIGERVTLTREFREDLSEEMTFEQEPEGGEGAGHRESGETVLQTEGSANATTLNLTKQAQGTAPLQFCEQVAQATFSPLTEGRLKS